MATRSDVPIRDSGFGLNYDRGFQGKAGSTFYGGGYDLGANRSAEELYRQRAAAQQTSARDAAQFGFQNQLQAGQLGQRERESQRSNQQYYAGLANQRSLADTQANAATLSARLGQQRWEELFPWAKEQLGNFSGQYGSQYTGTGQQGDQPLVSDAPVYTGGQIQQQANAARAQNDRMAQTRGRQQAGKLAGMGYGSRSPLGMAIQNSIGNQAMASSAEQERQLRSEAAGLNAKQVLAGQTARESQFANRQQEDIERKKVYTGFMGGLLGNLFGQVT